MKSFWVSGTLTCTFTQNVEAEDIEEAKQKVKEMKGVDLAWDSEDTEIHDAGEITPYDPIGGGGGSGRSDLPYGMGGGGD